MNSVPCGAGIAMVHVGKTGGSTIMKLIRKDCHTWVAERWGINGLPKGICPGEDRPIPNESMISKHVVAYWHERQVPVARYTSFIVMVRNPIERIISIFLMGHPVALIVQPGRILNRTHAMKTAHHRAEDVERALPLNWVHAFYSCFPTLNAFAEALPNELPRSPASKQPRCASIGLSSVQGMNPGAGHMRWNYNFYVRPLIAWNDAREERLKAENGASCPAKTIYVLRTEQLWYDWQSVNALLGDTEAQVPDGIHERKGTTTSRLAKASLYNRSVSQLGLANLCRALSEEISLYEEILFRAANLDEGERWADLRKVDTQCPGLQRSRIRAPSFPQLPGVAAEQPITKMHLQLTSNAAIVS